MRSRGDPVLYLSNPYGVGQNDRRLQLDALEALNQGLHRELGNRKYWLASNSMRWLTECRPPYLS